MHEFEDLPNAKVAPASRPHGEDVEVHALPTARVERSWNADVSHEYAAKRRPGGPLERSRIHLPHHDLSTVRRHVLDRVLQRAQAFQRGVGELSVLARFVGPVRPAPAVEADEADLGRARAIYARLIGS